MKKNGLPTFSRFTLGLIIVSLIVGGMAYGHLPERVPSHWNIHGEIDGYSGRFFGAFGIPLMTLGLYFLMVFLPRIDPKRANYGKFIGAYNTFIVLFVLFMLSLYALILLAAFGYEVDIGIATRIGLGLLFIVTGNYMTKVHHNYFFGIKTPWTLASEKVWVKTHRLGGLLFVAAGVLTAASVFLGPEIGFILTIGSLIGASVISAVYSYFVFRAEENSG